MALITQPLRTEHEQLLPHIEELRAAADAAGGIPQDLLRARIDDALHFLSDHLIPHARAEDEDGGGGGGRGIRVLHGEAAERGLRIHEANHDLDGESQRVAERQGFRDPAHPAGEELERDDVTREQHERDEPELEDARGALQEKRERADDGHREEIDEPRAEEGREKDREQRAAPGEVGIHDGHDDDRRDELDLYTPSDESPFDPAQMQVVDWDAEGVDVPKEFGPTEKGLLCIQDYLERRLAAAGHDVVILDHGI